MFGGQTATKALQKDIDKLRTQSPDIDNQRRYDQKWSVIIARTKKQRNNLGKMVDQLKVQYPNSCWYVHEYSGYLAVLHRMESHQGECAAQPLRTQANQERQPPFNRNLGILAKPNHCMNRDQLGLPDNVVNPETQFLKIISKDSDRFHTALTRNNNAWEKHAQVLISTRFQCHTLGYSYEEKIREKLYVGTRRTLDFHLKNTYAIELKVQIGNRGLESHSSIDDVLNSSIAKMETWRPDTPQKRWIVAIITEMKHNCDEIMEWMNDEIPTAKKIKTGADTSAKPQLKNPCNGDWRNDTPLGTKMLDTKRYSYNDTKGTGYFKVAVVWVHKSSGQNRVLLVLICLRNQNLSPCT